MTVGSKPVDLLDGAMALELLDAGSDNAPNFQHLPIFGDDVWVRLIGSLQLGPTTSLVQALHRKFPIQHGNYDHVGARLNGLIDYENVLVENPSVSHGVTADPKQESRLGVGDKYLGEVNSLGAQVLRRAGKPCTDAIRC